MVIKMARIRIQPTQEQLEDMKAYRKEFDNRYLSNRFVSYMSGYSYSYITAVLNGDSPLTIKLREAFNYIIDAVDSIKMKKN